MVYHEPYKGLKMPDLFKMAENTILISFTSAILEKRKGKFENEANVCICVFVTQTGPIILTQNFTR